MSLSPRLPALDPLPNMRLPQPDPSVVFCEVDAGAVLLSTTEEVYYGLNAVGARIWSLLPPQHREFDDLCAALVAEYPDADPDELRADVAALLDDLIRSRLVLPDPR
ncbi:MAG TPA: PqqD family protein [Gemmatimonadales bacterium]|nr:PqqD family protein [Gemmatimonadales bacterium]